LRHISFAANEDLLTEFFAEILHNEPFRSLSPGVLINFKVTLFRDKQFRGAMPHSGKGLLTLPTCEIGELFLRLYSDGHLLFPAGRKLIIRKCVHAPQIGVIDSITRDPYISPIQRAEGTKRSQESGIRIRQLQFGRECRDSVFSVEWERALSRLSSGKIEFVQETRQIWLTVPTTEDETGIDVYGIFLPGLFLSEQVVALGFSLIQDISLSREPPSIYFTMNVAPSLNKLLRPNSLIPFISPSNVTHLLKPLSYLDEKHKPVVPYISTTLRVVLDSVNDLEEFKKLAKKVHIRIRYYAPRVERRGLYDESLLQAIDRWFGELPYQVAFYCAELLQDCLLDAQEMRVLIPLVENLFNHQGTKKTSSFLRHFISVLDGNNSDVENNVSQDILGLFRSNFEKFDFNAEQLDSSAEGVVECFHATITPTSIRLSGMNYVTEST
jgi:RNA-dependent RNA polymerase